MMDEIEKQDLQFWFYNGYFVDRLGVDGALKKACTEVKKPLEEARDYLKAVGRLTPAGELREFTETLEADEDEYLDFEWTAEILIHQAGLRGDDLHRALGIIFKLSPEDAAADLAEASLSKEDEGEN